MTQNAARLRGCMPRVWRDAPVAAIVFLLLGRTIVAAPVEDYVGKTVAIVVIETDGRAVSDTALTDLVEVRQGEPLGMGDVRESIVHFVSLGRFSDVRVEAAAQSDGVVVSFELVSLRTIRRVAFRGELGISEGRLREILTDRYGTRKPPTRPEEAADILRDAYRAMGYLRAAVQPSVVALADPAEALLVFEIEPGRRAVIGNIQVMGVQTASMEQLLERLSLEFGKPYDRDAIQRRLERYADDLRSQNYLEARVDHATSPRQEGAIVDLDVTIERGPRVTVRFEGDPLPENRQSDLAPVVREASVDEDLLEDSARRIVHYLREQGYWRAEANYARTLTDDELVVTFHTRRGQLYRVRRIEILGNQAVPLAELGPLVQLDAGMPFVESAFEADVIAIVREYRRRGYVEAAVTPKVNEIAGERITGAAQVELQVTVEEGVRTQVDRVAFDGNTTVPIADLQDAISVAPGQALYQPLVVADRQALLTTYLNRGYASASVESEIQFGADRTQADVVFRVREGPQIIVDHVIIVGNIRTSAATIRRELTLTPGAPLGAADLVESRRRLSALGIFRRVRISELVHWDDNGHDVIVSVEEAPVMNIGYGGGLEAGQRLRRATEGPVQAVERFEVAPRGFFEIGRRNLWGKNRSVDLFMRLSLRPPNAPTDLDGSNFGFSEYRVRGTYGEPRLFGSRADLFVTGFLDQSIRSSFNLNQRGVLAEARLALAPLVSISGRYTFNRNELFDERFEPEDQPLIDRVFPEISLSSFSVSLFRDTRDDPLDPRVGTFTEVDGELAGRAIGSQVGFAKTLLRGFAYRRIPGTERVVVATGARIGLAAGFPRAVVLPDLAPDGTLIEATVQDIPASARFFAGGDTTVRGYALDRLGDEETIDSAGFPKGGQALLIFNAELRVPVWRNLGAVAFLDVGNVYARVQDLDVGNIRGGAGFGVRYRSPIGPIRIDLGFKLDRLTFGIQRESLTALHISIGQAF